jgi:hypothetical protein
MDSLPPEILDIIADLVADEYVGGYDNSWSATTSRSASAVPEDGFPDLEEPNSATEWESTEYQSTPSDFLAGSDMDEPAIPYEIDDTQEEPSEYQAPWDPRTDSSDSFNTMFTPRTMLLNCALVCRNWQASFERLIWKHIGVRSSELATFEEAFKTRHRRRYLRTIYFDVMLPEYEGKARCRFERPADQRANDEAFSTAAASLLRLLRSWDDEPAHFPSRVDLHIRNVNSPSDYDFNDLLSCGHIVPYENDLMEARYANSIIRLRQDQDLPVVKFITKLERHARGRVVEMGSLIRIAQSFPNLNELVLLPEDDHKRYPEIRRTWRRSFAEALQVASFPKLQHAKFSLWHAPGELSEAGVRSALADNSLGRAVHRISRPLTTLVVDGSFTSDLLWSEADEMEAASSDEPLWPFLEELDVTLDLTAPEATWYFQITEKTRGEDGVTVIRDLEAPPTLPDADDPNEDDGITHSDYVFYGKRSWPNHHRVPSTEEMRPLLVAFAKAAQHMPALQVATVRFKIGHLGRDVFYDFRYDTRRYWTDNDGTRKRRLVMQVGDWRPDAELLAMLMDIGSRQHSRDIHISYGGVHGMQSPFSC